MEKGREGEKNFIKTDRKIVRANRKYWCIGEKYDKIP